MLIREQFNTLFLLVKKATEAITRVILHYILEQSKETMVEFSKGTTKVFKLI